MGAFSDQQIEDLEGMTDQEKLEAREAMAEALLVGKENQKMIEDGSWKE